MNQLLLKQQIEHFLLEDIGTGDVTSTTIFSHQERGKAFFQAKESGVLAGVEVIQTAYQLLDSTMYIELHFQDGDEINVGDTIATVKGSIQTIVTGERVILNILQRMSGIATMTKRATHIVQPSNAKICDTRKTTPGLRMFDKYAVTCGGGYNHRFGLYDGVMIKDNHITFVGSIKEAVQRVRQKVGPMVHIEVETTSETEVKQAVEAQCDVIMFDNQTPETIMTWQKLVPSSIKTEISGGIHLHNLAMYRHVDVDFISLGCLTHSAPSLDISLGGV